LVPDEVPEEEEDGQGMGWWPVLQIELDPASGFEPTTVAVIIACVYQLFDVVPPAWPHERPSSGASSSVLEGKIQQLPPHPPASEGCHLPWDAASSAA